MTPDDPRHGTYAGSTRHHKEGSTLCAPCLEARRRYNRRIKKNARRGWSGIVPVTTARRHVLNLHADGIPFDLIADRAGVSRTTILRISGAGRPTTQINAQTQHKILSVHIDPTADATYIQAWRVERRLRSLQALGWPLSEVAARTGWSVPNLNALANPDRWRSRLTVSRETFEKIDATYRALSMKTPEPSRWVTATKNRAAARGWAPPMAWNNIDDHDEKPTGMRLTRESKFPKDHYDEAIVHQTVNTGTRPRPLTAPEAAEVCRRLIARGHSSSEMENDYGIKVERYYLRRNDQWVPRGEVA